MMSSDVPAGPEQPRSRRILQIFRKVLSIFKTLANMFWGSHWIYVRLLLISWFSTPLAIHLSVFLNNSFAQRLLVCRYNLARSSCHSSLAGH
jgi:hypothetical protein